MKVYSLIEVTNGSEFYYKFIEEFEHRHDAVYVMKAFEKVFNNRKYIIEEETNIYLSK